MATKPVGCQDRDPVSSLDEQVSESWVLGEVGATVRRGSLLQGINAPRAEPEEDVDIMEPGALQETFAVMITNIPGKLCETSQAREEPENPVDMREDAFPPPPPSLTDLPSEAWFEKDGFGGPGYLGVSEVTSDLGENLMTPDKDLICEEMAEDHMAAGESDTWLHFSPDGSDTTRPEKNALVAGRHLSTDSNNSDDACAVGSPPFADDSEEEEEVDSDVTSCQQQWELDSRCKTLQPPRSASALVSTEKGAVPLANQQDELLFQNHNGLVPKRENQEAAQQVHGQGSAPLSTVAMEPSNQGGAASQGSGCTEAVGERHSRAGERTRGESEQTGGEKGQRDVGLERSEAVGQHGRGLLRYSKTARAPEPEAEEHSSGVYLNHRRQDSMESDSCDDSQSDSGVSTDFSPYSTLEDNTTISPGTPATAPKETPIDREIRRALAREKSLRRSRGLPDTSAPKEYVDIPLRKTVLTTKAEMRHGKDRQFAGKKMEHEIHEEVQREQDLIRLGKVPGVYDKGTVRQLRERKQLFEAFQQPSDFTLTVADKGKTTSRPSPRNISAPGNPEDASPQTSSAGSVHLGRRRSADLLSPRVYVRQEAEPVTTVDSGSPSVPSSSSATGRHGGINSRTQDEEEEEELAAKNNPFFKLRSSTNIMRVEKDIREAQERERELCKQRISLYGVTGGAVGGRFGGGGGVARYPAVPSSSVNGLTVPDSSPRRGPGPSAAHESPGRLNIWPPAPADDSRTAQQEVLRTPRTPRQRNPLVQRWEAGLVNGHYTEED